jgi:hypothetical protein
MRTQTLFIGVAVALATIGTAHAAGPRPLFQMPVPCGQTWDASTYDGHWPDEDSLDLAQRDDDGVNVSEGEPVLASAAGTVSHMATYGEGEHHLYLDHGNGWRTYYVHNEELPPLAIGQRVAQGEQIGRTSNSGADSVHIHYSQVADGVGMRNRFDGTAVGTYAADPGTWGTWGDDDAEEITSVNCAGNTFMGWNQGGDRYYLIYKPGTGEVKIVRVDDDGTGVTTTWSGTWSLGWTHMVPFYQPASGHPHALLYKSSTGRATFVRLNLWGEGITNLKSHTWYGGWTQLVPFTVGNVAYLVAYDSLHGYANIDRIKPTADGTTTLSSSVWGKGRTAIVPYTLGSSQYLLLYKGGDGSVEVDRITGSGDDVGLTEVWSGSWTGGWTDLVPITHDGARYLVGYKAASGQVKVWRLQANGQGVQLVSTLSWTKGWTAFSPFSLDGDGHLLLYKLRTGVVKTLRLKLGGAGFDTVWTGSWTKGWA